MTDGNAYLILGFCSYLVKQLGSLPPDNYVFSQENALFSAVDEIYHFMFLIII